MGPRPLLAGVGDHGHANLRDREWQRVVRLHRSVDRRHADVEEDVALRLVDLVERGLIDAGASGCALSVFDEGENLAPNRLHDLVLLLDGLADLRLKLFERGLRQAAIPRGDIERVRTAHRAPGRSLKPG